MITELPVGTKVLDKYTVSKVLFKPRDGDSHFYLAADDAGAAFIVEDVGATPPEDSPAKAAYATALAAVTQCQHANLAKVLESASWSGREYVVFEPTEGQPLDAIGDLDDGKRLDYSQQACDLLACLDFQEPSFVLDELDPTRMVLTGEGKLKLYDFRLARALKNPEQPLVSAEPKDKAATFKALADFLSFLVTHKRGHADLNRVRQNNPKLAAVVERCQKYLDNPGMNFIELRRTLGMAVQVSTGTIRPGADRVDQVVKLVRSVKPIYYLIAVTAVMAVVTIVGFITISFKPPPHTLAYIVQNQNALVLVDADDVTTVGTQSFENANLVGAILSPDYKKLVVADETLDQLRVLDLTKSSKENELPPIPLDGPPESVYRTADGRYGYVMIPTKNLLLKVTMTGTPKIHSKLVLNQPGPYLSMTSDGAYLFYASPKNGALFITGLRGKSVSKLPLPCKDLGPIAVTPDGKELWVVGQTSGTISCYDTAPAYSGAMQNCPVIDTINGLPPQCSQICFNADGTEAYVLSPESGAILVVDRNDHSLGKRIDTKIKEPVSWAFSKADSSYMWVVGEGGMASEIDMTQHAMLRTLRIGGTPTFIETREREKAIPVPADTQ